MKANGQPLIDRLFRAVVGVVLAAFAAVLAMVVYLN